MKIKSMKSNYSSYLSVVNFVLIIIVIILGVVMWIYLNNRVDTVPSVPSIIPIPLTFYNAMIQNIGKQFRFVTPISFLTLTFQGFGGFALGDLDPESFGIDTIGQAVSINSAFVTSADFLRDSPYVFYPTILPIGLSNGVFVSTGSIYTPNGPTNFGQLAFSKIL